MANPYKDWEAFPLADSPVGVLGDEALAAQAIQAPKSPAIDNLGQLGDEALAAQAIQAPGPVGPVATENDLASNRMKIAQELQDNTDLRRKLMASTTAEVGNQGPEAKLAYIESVMNRSLARGKSLNETISDPRYYPKSTTSQLGVTFSSEQQSAFNPLINQALSGSNIARFATGNESGGVHSGGAPIAFNPGSGERFVVENPDRKWAMNTQARLTPAPTPGRMPTLPDQRGQLAQVGVVPIPAAAQMPIMPVQARQLAQTGAIPGAIPGPIPPGVPRAPAPSRMPTMRDLIELQGRGLASR
jgi:hypothetical protein